MIPKVAVVGLGCTKFGELWHEDLTSLATKAGVEALEDADIDFQDIDALYGGSMSAGLFTKQEHIGALILDAVGGSKLGIPATRVEAACASGGLAVRQAYLSILAGETNITMAAGVEKMTDVSPEDAMDILMAAGDREWEGIHGATFPALYAMIARAHMDKYGTSEEDLAHVSAKNHENAMFNEIAQYQRKITVEQVLKSPMIASPLHLLDCSPVTDGAAALILATEETAKRICDTPIWIKGSAQASDAFAFYHRKSMTTMESVRTASKKAYEQAKVEPQNIDLAEVHDCFTIAEVMNIEDLGFVEKGRGGKAVEQGITTYDGQIPVNVSGGLKACGHPVGATGVKQICEVTKQLRGEASRQVQGAEIGLTLNVGGTGGTAVVHILNGLTSYSKI